VSGRGIFNLLVGLGALVAIALVAGPKLDLGGGDGDDEDAGASRERTRADAREIPARTVRQSSPRPKPRARAALPENPDEVKGSQEISLHRPANLRRALRVLERERRGAEGVFDGLRVAPGRIDTTIDTPGTKISLQIRPDFRIAFRSRHDFPNANNPRFRKQGLGAGAVDVSLPARILRRIDRRRSGSAARDLDYFVIRRDIIDFEVNYGAYLRSGPRPRIFLLEPDEPFRAIE
jgi:hypothetical protein